MTIVVCVCVCVCVSRYAHYEIWLWLQYYRIQHYGTDRRIDCLRAMLEAPTKLYQRRHATNGSISKGIDLCVANFHRLKIAFISTIIVAQHTKICLVAFVFQHHRVVKRQNLQYQLTNELQSSNFYNPHDRELNIIITKISGV